MTFTKTTSVVSNENYIRRVLVRCLLLSATVPIIFRLSSYLTAALVAAICVFIVTAKSDQERTMYVLFFAAFANVLKFNRSMSSMAILFELTYLVTKLVGYKKVPKYPVAGAVIIGGYALIPYLFTGNFTRNLYIKVVIWLFLMFFINLSDREKSEKPLILAFASGQLMAAILGHFTSFYPAIEVYLNDQFVYGKGSSGSYTTVASRFCGLLSDSNLFSVEILITLSLLLYLFYRKKITKGFYILAGGIIAASITSFSKTFFLGLAFLVLAFVFIMINRKLSDKFKAVAIILAGIVVFSQQLADNIGVYLRRFSEVSNVKELTTGRSSLAMTFLTDMIEKGTLVFGTGLRNPYYYKANGRPVGAHNAYIQLFYMFGIVGAIIAVGCFVYCYTNGGMNKFKVTSILHAVPLLVLLYGMMTVDLFQYDFFMLSLMLVLFIYKAPGKRAAPMGEVMDDA